MPVAIRSRVSSPDRICTSCGVAFAEQNATQCCGVLQRIVLLMVSSGKLLGSGAFCKGGQANH